jgi:hypothetical protein
VLIPKKLESIYKIENQLNGNGANATRNNAYNQLNAGRSTNPLNLSVDRYTAGGGGGFGQVNNGAVNKTFL